LHLGRGTHRSRGATRLQSAVDFTVRAVLHSLLGTVAFSEIMTNRINVEMVARAPNQRGWRFRCRWWRHRWFVTGRSNDTETDFPGRILDADWIRSNILVQIPQTRRIPHRVPTGEPPTLAVIGAVPVVVLLRHSTRRVPGIGTHAFGMCFPASSSVGEAYQG